MIPRPYQTHAVNSIYAYFAEKDGHPLIILPTGTGKSFVQADFLRGAIGHYPETRVIMVTHSRELIRQNLSHLLRMWPSAPAGICSSGLGKRDFYSQVLFAGIQTAHRYAERIGHRDLVLVDEAHLIPRNADTMYGRFISDLRAINPALKVIGFTATDYRLDSGRLHEGKGALFTDIAYEYGIGEAIDDGYLCEVVPKDTGTKLDVSGVHRRGGEFIAGELEAAVDNDAITQAAIAETVEKGQNRRAWLLFGTGIKHANHLAEAVRGYGIACAVVTGDTPLAERDRILTAFKGGELRAISNANVLTTGFDAPLVDLIGVYRPTESAGLHVQILGRGTRLIDSRIANLPTAEERKFAISQSAKQNCLVLDFAGNTARHGPLDAIRVKKPGEGGGEAPIKVCPDCATICHAAARTCPSCGFQFPEPQPELHAQAATDALLTSQITAEWATVTDVFYSRHEKAGKPPSLRTDYRCGVTQHSEWVCFEHGGFARQKACQWWMRRMPGQQIPNTVDEALAQADSLPKPERICIYPDGKYSRVTAVEF